jgi:predicted transcriptional regulator
MRTLIDLPDSQIPALADRCERVRQPRAAIIREAVAEFLERHAVRSMDSAYGLWGAEGTEGLAYQEKARTEW